MAYYEDTDKRKKKKKKSSGFIAAIIFAVLIIAAALAIFLNWDRLKFYIENGELPKDGYTMTPKPEETPEPTATPEPVEEIVPEGTTIGTRFNAPAGYEKVTLDADSFGMFLRNYALQPYGTVAKLADGTDNELAPTAGVFNQTIRANGLQQCADAIMRLYAEYRYARGEYDHIWFNCYTTPVFKLDFSTWTNAMRVKANGRKLEWYKSDSATEGDTSWSTFLYYLDNVFLYANTYSLKQQMMQIDPTQLSVGDCLIITAEQTGTADGHAIIVVDAAVNTTTGEKIFMLAEGNTPATETYILVDGDTGSVWFRLNDDGTFSKTRLTGEKVDYPLDAFRRFKQ